MEEIITIFRILLLVSLIVCAIATALSKRVMTALIIFTTTAECSRSYTAGSHIGLDSQKLSAQLQGVL